MKTTTTVKFMSDAEVEQAVVDYYRELDEIERLDATIAALIKAGITPDDDTIAAAMAAGSR